MLHVRESSQIKTQMCTQGRAVSYLVLGLPRNNRQERCPNWNTTLILLHSLRHWAKQSSKWEKSSTNLQDFKSEKQGLSPGRVGKLLRAWSWYTQVAGWSGHKQESTNECMDGCSKSMFLSLCLPLFLKSIKKIFFKEEILLKIKRTLLEDFY